MNVCLPATLSVCLSAFLLVCQSVYSIPTGGSFMKFHISIFSKFLKINSSFIKIRQEEGVLYNNKFLHL